MTDIRTSTILKAIDLAQKLWAQEVEKIGKAVHWLGHVASFVFLSRTLIHESLHLSNRSLHLSVC